jgi:CheY-like chemotaxis protein
MFTSAPPILLVEDNHNDVELTLSALRGNHLTNEVVVTRDGAQALDYLYARNRYAGRTTGNPALMLLDLCMPKVDGLEVLRQIRSDPQLKPIPVVIFTSSRHEQDLITSYNLGVNAYMVKPVDFQQFFEAIKVLGVFCAVVTEPVA